MARPKSDAHFVRKNVTLPADLESALPQLRLASGAVSDSELIRQALINLAKVHDIDLRPLAAKDRVTAAAAE